MMALAIELSSIQGSVALLSDEAVLAEETWNERSIRGQQLFRVLPDMLKKHGQTMKDIDCFIAGRGPGVYSGMRVAITAAQSLALPGKKTVYTLSSGEALAREMSETAAAGQPIAVVGDARRNQIWYGLFRRQDGILACDSTWALAGPDELPAKLLAGCLVVSSDRERLAPVLDRLDKEKYSCLPENRFPLAAWLGRTALEKIRRGLPSEPITPIYMHAAVAIVKK